MQIRKSVNGDDCFVNKRQASDERHSLKLSQGDPDTIMTQMIHDAKQRTIERGRHVWNEIKCLNNILSCIKRQEVTDEVTDITRLACACGGAGGSATVASNGPSKLSMDLVGIGGKGAGGGYCESADDMRLVRSTCNTQVTNANIPEERKDQRSHRNRVTNGMTRHTINRYEVSNITAISPNLQARPRSEESMAAVKLMIGDGPIYNRKVLHEYHYMSYDEARATLEDDPVCPNPGCNNKLTFGDENGKLVLKNDSTQASPNRLDNSNALYSPENFRFVCFAFQRTDNPNPTDNVYPEDLAELLLEGERLNDFKEALKRRIDKVLEAEMIDDAKLAREYRVVSCWR
jgi:hypothetical protein